jgi:hypothetical protein
MPGPTVRGVVGHQMVFVGGIIDFPRTLAGPPAPVWEGWAGGWGAHCWGSEESDPVPPPGDSGGAARVGGVPVGVCGWWWGLVAWCPGPSLVGGGCGCVV